MCGSIQLKLEYSKAESVGTAISADAIGTKDDSLKIGDAIKEANQAVEVVEAINKLWGSLLDSVSWFMKIVDQVVGVSDFPHRSLYQDKA
jgi:hypothetical protein